VLALALTALAAAAPPLAVDRSEFTRGGRTETRLAAYDRRSGRRRVLAGGSRGRRGLGTFIGGWSASGDRVAYVEARAGRRRMVVRLHVVRVGATVERVETLWLFRRPTGRSVPLDAAMTSRGELAWLEPGGVFARRRGRRTRRVSRVRYGAVALEDDRTLRLSRGDADLAYLDLRPGRRPEPYCGGRSRFRRVLRTRHVVVSRARYVTSDRWWDAIRACRRSDGRDPLIDWTLSYFMLGSTLRVAGADRDWVVISNTACGHHGDGCTSSYRAHQAGTAREGPYVSLDSDVDPVGGPGRHGLAVSDRGLPAWVFQDAGGARLVVVRGEDVYSVVDSGAPGSIRDLAWSGEVLSWTHDGVPRSFSPG
jgi:hypothetical protein